jgi:hypothetical protein
VAHLGDTATLVAAPALPLLLLAAENQLSRPRHTLLATLGLAGGVALVLVSGSASAVVAASLLLGARLLLAFLPRLVRGDGADARRILSTAAAVVGGLLLAAPQLVPTFIALREAGAGGAGMADGAAAPLQGVAGFVVRYVSHSPAPIFALAAVPLLRSLPALRAAAAVVGLVLALFALRGGPDASGPLLLAFDLALAVLAGLALIHLGGLAQLIIITGDASVAARFGTLPFLFGDLLKLGIAVLVLRHAISPVRARL